MFAPDVIGLSRIGYADFAARGFKPFVRPKRKVPRCDKCKRRQRNDDHVCFKGERKRRYR